MAIGIFGGTFNPPHLGHLRLCEAFARQLGLERVLVIPTFVPPHKTAPDLASCEDRLAMCRRMFSADSRCTVSDTEIRRGGKSYTVDTLEALQAQYPGEQFYLLVGSDMLQSFDTWYRSEDIEKLCTLCAAPRESGGFAGRDGAVSLESFEPVEISSTQIREKVRLGEDVCAWVGADVADYIRQKELYTDPWTAYRRLLREKLSDYRLYHSFCVADSARKLAEKYGFDPDRAYTAGLLHDVMKDTDKKQTLVFMGKAGVSLTEAELHNPKLWHAMAGEAFLRTELRITDEDILRAVRYHTTGRGDMTLPEKILYIADYISADRAYDGVEKMRDLAEKSLESAMMFGLTFTISELCDKEQVIHPDSVNCYNDLCVLKDKRGGLL
ncbi:MAG: nicotinate (nicotinamide) nucleotide adenylyltransferase [Acutalibacteraceae bacterium]